ncbi:conserved hypothetical protein (DUF4038) [Formosa agariphila KMM 3901]|uniref:DUF4038 domain-containing protein n=1 Tax=Formosa agariphila (strain DSM 15362 / KCTC 12365 / LMG 23005 / KMM 3901 / M-2Alg 35-1) TaxID=1347342 RepID=T2KM70_FORAG|nr:DUF5060 domain-containing protein [Formosa agariphila]CDF79536.1 conserved hypothetical protein (DUF4038) [Formosa agariphila KMM 3901]
MKKFLLFACVLLTIACQSHAQKTIQGHKWETVDITFIAKGHIAKPFQVDLSATFQAPDGSQLTVPGFYNDNNTWVVRFNPNQEGTWTSVSTSSIKKLNGVTHIIEVSPAHADVHGGITVSKTDPQKLVYEDGSPYNLVANEVDWLFALDYGNPNLTKTKTLVEAISANGYNQIIMNVYAYDLDWTQSENIDPKWDFGSKKEIFPFLGDNENPDYSALNVEFFKHYDRVIDLLEDHGISAHIMIYVWNKMVNWPEANSEADNMYFDYVVKRYQAKSNVVWDISKEALRYGYDDPNYITERIDRLKALDAYKRLVTVHDFEYCEANPDKVDIISAQFWHSDIYSKMLNLKAEYPNKPIINLENGAYEACQYDIFLDSNYSDPISAIERNYQCAFAGTYTSYYWQGMAWNVVIYDPFADEVTVQPKFEYYKHFQAFLDKVNFEKLQPTNRYNSSGYCLANTEDGEFVYYMPKANSALAVKGLPKAEKLEIQWFNPLTGIYTEPYQVDFKSWLVVNPKFKGVDNVFIVKLINRKQ